MKANTTKNTGTGASGRPSLYSFDSRERESGEVFSILEALEPRVRRAAIWWRATLIGLVAVLAGALYLIGSGVDLYHHLSPATSHEAAADRMVVTPKAPKLPSAPTATSLGESNAAAIVAEAPSQPHEPLVAAVTDKSVQSDAVVNAAAEAADSHPAATESASATPVVPASSLKPVSSTSTDIRHIPKEKAVMPAPKPGSLPAKHGPAVAKTDAPRTGKDGDVDLIAALVAHVSHGGPERKETKKSVVKAPADVRASAVAAKRERRTDVGRDIVVRNDGDTTAALVSRCRALGLIEGELCRLRICSGLWGTDPACPGTAVTEAQSSSGR